MYISGDQTSVSPSLAAYYQYDNREDLNKDGRKPVRIVSIGASEEEADRQIEKSLNRWAYKLTTLNTEVKRNTQDWLAKFFLSNTSSD